MACDHEKEVAELTVALRGMVELVAAWQRGILADIGIRWKRQPPAMETAIRLVGMSGAGVLPGCPTVGQDGTGLENRRGSEPQAAPVAKSTVGAFSGI